MAEYQSDAGSTKDNPYLYGMSFVNICEKIDLVLMAPQCIFRSSLTIAKPEHKSDIQLPKKDTSYLNLLGELWGVYCKYFGESNRMQAVKTAWCGAMIAVM